MTNTVLATVEVELTPEQLGRAFWALDDGQQVAFFAAVGAAVARTRADPSCRWPGLLGEYGEGQWYHLGNRLLEPAPRKGVDVHLARNVLMSMAAPLFLHTLRAAGDPL